MLHLFTRLFLLFAAFTIIAIVANTSVIASGKPKTDEVVGIWQDLNLIAAGWSNTYQFFKDGTFVFNHNQMNCLKRELWYSGRWKILGNDIHLTIEKRKVIIGGRKGDDPVCGPAILEGKEVTKLVQPPEERILHLGNVRIEKGRTRFGDEYEMPTATIGTVKYWKFYDDPKQYPLPAK